MAERSEEAGSMMKLYDKEEGYDLTGGFEDALNDGDGVKLVRGASGPGLGSAATTMILTGSME